LISAKEAIIVFGIMVGFGAGAVFQHYQPWGWRCMIGFSSIPALVLTIGILFIPDSPRWFELQKREEDALAALRWFREDKTEKEVKAELQDIHKDALSTAGKAESWLEPFYYRRPMVIGIGLVFFQQVTGQPSVLYFAPSIFEKMGFGAESSLSSFGIGVLKFVATFASAALIDKYGRRVLLLTGISMMTVALMIMAMIDSRHANSEYTSNTENWITFLAFMVYVSGYQVGFGPISWLMVAEVFPLHVKGAAISVIATTNWSMNLVMTFTQPELLERYGISRVFSAYAALCLLALLFVGQCVPETKNKTLEDISLELCPDKST
jgi:sugar porter (SP) family MFS transporter